MKKIVLCFDRTNGLTGVHDGTNAGALFRLLEDNDRQIGWYHTGAPRGRRGRGAAADEARAAVIEAYRFLADQWVPGDALFVFGADRGAYCARTLSRLLGTIGLMPQRADDLLGYVLATYALPRTARTARDWQRITELAAELTGQPDTAVPVTYLGLWDTERIPGAPRLAATEVLDNVSAGRHAVAIDGARSGEPLTGDGFEEVWFRGTRTDVAGRPGACRPLADIALDWVLDGAITAGVMLQQASVLNAPTPSEIDALAGNAHLLPWRRVPIDALIHASVEIYLRAHPDYWRRLPARVVWADTEWVARSERLVTTETPVAARGRTAELAVAS